MKVRKYARSLCTTTNHSKHFDLDAIVRICTEITEEPLTKTYAKNDYKTRVIRFKLIIMLNNRIL